MGFFYYEPIPFHLELIAIVIRIGLLGLGGYGGCTLVRVWGADYAIAFLLGMGLMTLWTWDWTHGVIKEWATPVIEKDKRQ
jgi:hypothetical protein